MVYRGGDWRIARETAGVKSLLAVVVSRIEHVLRESPCLSPKLKTAGDNSESNALIAADWNSQSSQLSGRDIRSFPEMFAAGVTLPSNRSRVDNFPCSPF